MRFSSSSAMIPSLLSPLSKERTMVPVTVPEAPLSSHCEMTLVWKSWMSA
jgi:hypothetical protein